MENSEREKRTEGDENTFGFFFFSNASQPEWTASHYYICLSIYISLHICIDRYACVCV
jgi:hypothetical protein